jgi:hypothetical protein
MNEADYARIGRAVVERLRSAKSTPHNPFALPRGDFVRRRSDGGVDINIGVATYCVGCGLELKAVVADGKLNIGSASDSLRLIDSV